PMLRTVVPLEKSRWRIQHSGDIQDAFRTTYTRGGLIFFFIVIAVEPFKKARGWQLHLVTNDYQLASPQHGPKRILRLKLGGFVHHNKIEIDLTGHKVLSHGQRAHHEARLQRLKSPRSSCDKLAQGNMTTLLLYLMAEKARLAE